MKKYYLLNVETGEKKPVQFNEIINNISLYIKLNFLWIGFYKAIKTNNNTYNIIDKFSGEVAYIINKGGIKL